MVGGEPAPSPAVSWTEEPTPQPSYWDTLDTPLRESRRQSFYHHHGGRHPYLPHHSRSRLWAALVYPAYSPPRHAHSHSATSWEEVVGRCRRAWLGPPLAIFDNAADQPPANICPRAFHGLEVPSLCPIDPPQSSEADTSCSDHLAPR